MQKIRKCIDTCIACRFMIAGIGVFFWWIVWGHNKKMPFFVVVKYKRNVLGFHANHTSRDNFSIM